MKKYILLALFILITISGYSRLTNGYRGLTWGSAYRRVASKYKKFGFKQSKIYGLNNYVSYTQYSPTLSIKKRTFFFFKNALCGVYISYSYGPNELNKLKAISKALLRKFGNRQIRSYNSRSHGKVLQHIEWKSKITKLTWFLSQSGTSVAVTGVTNYLYFESIKHKKLIARALKKLRARQSRQQTQRQEQQHGF